MIVEDSDIVGVIVPPCENNSPLLVDPDAVMPFQVSGELFQAISGRYTKMVEFGRRVELVELYFGAAVDFGGKLPGGLEIKNLPRLFVAEAPDHADMILIFGNLSRPELRKIPRSPASSSGLRLAA